MIFPGPPTGQLLAVALTAVLSLPGPADAGRKVVTGQIDAIDSINRTISLSSGETFRAGPKVKLSTRRIGENVIVVYETVAGGLQAIKVRRVPQSVESFVPLPVRKPEPAGGQPLN